MNPLMQKEVLIAVILAVVVIVAIVAGRGLKISREQLILDPRRDPPQRTAVDVLNDVKIANTEMGNITGASGSVGPADVEMLKGAEIKDSKVKDITGISTGSRQK